jgi:trimeric autotransporter adhesin
LKKDIVTIPDASQKLSQINGVSFRWNENGPKDTATQFGVIAQEVQKVLPEAVHKSENGYLMVNYSAITSLLVETVKNQQAAIQELRAKVDSLAHH